MEVRLDVVVLAGCPPTASAPSEPAPEPAPPLKQPTGPPLAHGSCSSLVAPWTVETAEDAWAAASLLTPGDEHLGVVEEIARARVERGDDGVSCPSWASESSHDYITGPCRTSAGDEWSGIASFGDVAAPEEPWVFRFAYEDFSVTAGDGSFSFAADGAVTHVFSQSPTVRETTAYWVRMEHDGSLDYPVGEWFRHQIVIQERAPPVLSVLTWNSYIWVVEDDGPTGDMCQDWDVVASPTCPEEGDGTAWIEGTATAELRFEGSTVCDGCVDVVIDGVPAGAVCPDEGLWPD